MVAMARERNIKRVYVPVEDAPEAALIREVEVLPVTTLRQLVMHINGNPVAADSIVPYIAEQPLEDEADGHHPVDMSHIKGQEHVKRALEVAAAGSHNLLILCPQFHLGRHQA
jgi:magnesium chelatase family protein